MEAVLDEYVELVSEALLEKVAEAICEKLKRQLVQEKYNFFCTKFRKYCASLFWDLYPLCAVRCTVQVRAHLGLSVHIYVPMYPQKAVRYTLVPRQIASVIGC